ncbi:MAG: hypothetical protein WDA20_03150 [Desulfuromonadales bacterium]|jgi:hypothetical protein
MSVNNRFLAAVFFGILLLGVRPAVAVDHLGAHFRDPEEFQQVIDLRCTRCHTRERIEVAMQRREALEPLTRRMIGRGAVVTERDKEVLGTFWGSPLKPKNDSPEEQP